MQDIWFKTHLNVNYSDATMWYSIDPVADAPGSVFVDHASEPTQSIPSLARNFALAL
jgi:hypothetical protein